MKSAIAEAARVGEERAPLRSERPLQSGTSDDLVQPNLGFVARIAGEYRDRGVPYEDLLNEGNVGLLEAARRYDPSRGVKFITYAVWWIRKSILKALAEHGRLVRVPEYQIKRLNQARDAERLLLTKIGGALAPADLPPRLRREIDDLDRVRQARLREFRLDEKIGGDGTLPIGGTLAADRPSPEEEFLKTEAMRLLGAALGGLTIRERLVLALRYGFGSERSLSLHETGKVLGLSGERVRQIETAALQRMRKSVTWARSRRAPLRRPRVARPARDRAPSVAAGIRPLV